MHRVRVGLTGLACVFLLVMLATAFLGSRRESGGRTAADNAAQPPSEPLAQLGVAPGNPPPDDSAERAAASREIKPASR